MDRYRYGQSPCQGPAPFVVFGGRCLVFGVRCSVFGELYEMSGSRRTGVELRPSTPSIC